MLVIASFPFLFSFLSIVFMCWKSPADVRLVRVYHADNQGVDY